MNNNITVPLKPDHLSPSERGILAARDYLVKRSNAKRMGRPLKWVTLPLRLASQIADLPPLGKGARL